MIEYSDELNWREVYLGGNLTGSLKYLILVDMIFFVSGIRYLFTWLYNGEGVTGAFVVSR